MTCWCWKFRGGNACVWIFCMYHNSLSWFQNHTPLICQMVFGTCHQWDFSMAISLDVLRWTCGGLGANTHRKKFWWIDCRRQINNLRLNRRNEYWKSIQRFQRKRPGQKPITETRLKDMFWCVKEVSSTTLRQIKKDCGIAFGDWFKPSKEILGGKFGVRDSNRENQTAFHIVGGGFRMPP